jgi:CBS domain-containing protein
MARARDVMTMNPECIRDTDTLQRAAQRMRDLDVGALPICGDDDRLIGMLTDRDIAVKCVAAGGDPAVVTAGDLAQGKPVTIGADDDIDEAASTMMNHQVRRLPVIDGTKLVGIISQSDLAAVLPSRKVGQLLEEISETK